MSKAMKSTDEQIKEMQAKLKLLREKKKSEKDTEKLNKLKCRLKNLQTEYNAIKKHNDVLKSKIDALSEELRKSRISEKQALAKVRRAEKAIDDFAQPKTDEAPLTEPIMLDEFPPVEDDDEISDVSESEPKSNLSVPTFFPKPKCEMCGKEVSDKVADNSKRFHNGRILCWNNVDGGCQEKAKGR